jgi:rSAM/selenodomain-associated transferase 1
MSDEHVALLVFAKAPRPGKVKTRLATLLGDEGAARLYAAFLEDTWATACGLLGVRPELWAASEEDAAGLAPRPCRVQTSGDLGVRMHAAMADALGRASRVLLVGSDHPTVPPALFRDAIGALETHGVVLGPSADGGFFLVGARGAAVGFDPGVRWSSRHALADTLAGLAGRSVRLIRPWYDVDTPEDLHVLRAHLALWPRAAPRTAELLASF